ncbi:MAG: hypothetical protein FWE36_01720 [Erysipelotrichales bacterium]|nr:hypothetical protein [Erysipelotrichales bacterium]
MKRCLKYSTNLILALIGILSLSGCVGNYDNIVDYFLSEWRWWNVTFVILVAILVVLMVFLVHAMIRCKVKDK